MEQIVDAVPLVPLLDDPVTQMVEHLPDVMRFFDLVLPVPEQVIEVPKILLARYAAGGTAGGSVDDHILFFPFAADYGAERRHSSSWSWRGEFLVFKVFLPGRVQQRFVVPWNACLSVDFPVGGGLQDFLPGQSSSASSLVFMVLQVGL